MEPGLLDQGVNLMLVGMGTVFTFLTLLVAAMSLSAWVLQRFGRQDSNARTAATADAEVAAISAALHHHQQRRQ